MSDKERSSLENMLADIAKALRQAKASLAADSVVDLHSNLKTVHTATTKAKNSVVDVALAFMDAQTVED